MWSELEECGGEKLQQACRQFQVQGGWTKPPFQTIKVNCDGAWYKQTERGGFGWVARDFAGIFKRAGGVGNILCESSLMAKMEAMRAALLTYVERGFGIVQVETDSKVMVDMLNGVLQPEAVMEGVI
ncbi:hypothetical protein DVH24_009802 [Malus domestica]|uniref:RNase H type-1 domain-containing protein n=1 Tax=Malus domestica TaxID=3750 RepID=A0A498KKR3_MALDO|nr:hypothetical protein DVH24_009802 [Malus domestica]